MYRGNAGVFGGLIMVALGVGLTVFSYSVASPGGTYIVFFGLIIGGLISMFRGIAAPGAAGSSRRGYKTRSGHARVPPLYYIEEPSVMPPGYCWQCGRKVKPEVLVCVACGAAQMTQASRGAAATTTAVPAEKGWEPAAAAPVAPGGYGPPPGRMSGGPRPGGPHPGDGYPAGPYPPAGYPGGEYAQGPYPGGPYRGGPQPQRGYPLTPNPFAPQRGAKPRKRRDR